MTTNNYLSLILLAVSVVGVLVYGILAPWHRSTLGWAIMGLFVSLGLATGALASLYVFGNYEARSAIFSGVYLLLILVVGSIVVNIIRYQLPRRDK